MRLTRISKMICSVVAILALTSASLQAAAGLQVICVEGGGQVKIENINEQSFGNRGMHRITHHQSTGVGASAGVLASTTGYSVLALPQNGFDVMVDLALARLGVRAVQFNKADQKQFPAASLSPEKARPAYVWSVENSKAVALPIIPATITPSIRSRIQAFDTLLL